MIVFDLSCPQAHVFEAWFGSSTDYEDQRARGLLMCPMCGSAEIDKAVMAPRVGAKGNQQSDRGGGARAEAGSGGDASVPMAGGTPSLAEMKSMLQALAQAQAKALEGSEYVGKRFTDEARAIHLGEIEQRPIHGQATPEQARSLIEDGIAVAPLPFPVRPPGRDN